MKRSITFVLVLGLIVSIFCIGASAYAADETFYDSPEGEMSMEEATERIIRNINPSAFLTLPEGVNFAYNYQGIVERDGAEWHQITFGEDTLEKFTALRHFLVSGFGEILELDIDTNEYLPAVYGQSDVIEPYEGSLYIENNTLTVIMNLPSMDSISTWTYYAEGESLLAEREYGEPRQMGYAQDAFTWVFEAMDYGLTQLVFEYNREAPDEPQRGFRFTFWVDETLDIINIAGISEIFDYADEYFNMIAMFSVIINEVYESSIVAIEKSPYPYELLGEEVSIYSITCENSRTCMLSVTSDGEVYINENEDTPNFKHIILANLITIGEPVNDYSYVDYDAFVESIAYDLVGEKIDISRTDDAIVDHRNVRVYVISHAYQVDGYLAIDDTTEYVYYDDGATGNYCELLYINDHYIIGESVTLTEGM